MKLTNRLQAIADLVQKKEGLIADVGTDHALIPIYLAKHLPNCRLYALDVNQGPLENAKENVASYGLSDRVDFRLSDGLSACRNEKISTIIIAGMGGILIEKILTQGQSCLSEDTELILSPHSDYALVRRKIHELGFHIEKERHVKEDGQIYTIIYAKSGKEEPYRDIEYSFGKNGISMDKEVLKELRKREKLELEKVLSKLEAISQESPVILEKKEKIIIQINELKKMMELA